MNPQLRPQGQLELPDQDEMVTVKFTVPRSEVAKLQAWIHSDAWEQAQKLRKANLEEMQESLVYCVDQALNQNYGAVRVFASFLGSLYNGQRVKADVGGISLLDMANFEHLMNVIRLCKETHSEPHSFFVDGNELFEQIIKKWKLEKGRRS